MVYFVILYLIVTIIVGLLAARLVKNTEDYLLAGRRLPFYIATATLFATWFGSETILGASSEFAEGGLIAVVRDPFGAALCLFLVGMFFARPLYRMKLLTLGDFYRNRYGNLTEFFAGICIMLTYLAWIAAQMVAFGIITSSLTGLELTQGILLGCALVTLYTFIGGMWSVSVTDFMQLIFILIGLVAATLEIFQIVSFRQVFENAPEGFFRFYPHPEGVDVMNYIAAWITIGLGSIAGQDIFQRVMASRSEKVAVRASYTAGAMYLSVALIPLLLALAARKLAPELLDYGMDTQMVIPGLITRFTSPFVQILLFGALLSAILSTASSALLAPAAILGENIIKPRWKGITDKQLLWSSRVSVLIVSIIALYMALQRGNIYELVGEAASVGLVSLFTPLCAGLFWKEANATGALISIFSGLIVWLIASWLGTNIEPIIYGLAAGILGMIGGSFTGNKN
ncbi:MAG: sodium:solute symporter [Bacteroidetes bacterium]|nr:MAG: sodium:solute symporter [Bacteroidota bacterium]